MAPPKLRTRTRPTTASPSPSPIEEKKPLHNDLMIEEAATSDEKFGFSFSEEGLTSAECREMFDTFTSRDDFHSAIPEADQTRFLSKSIIGGRNQPIKCFNCVRVYASASGLIAHLKKCQMTAESAPKLENFRKTPNFWFKLKEKDRIPTLEQIFGSGKFNCFSKGCRKSFKGAPELAEHLNFCVEPEYFTYKDRVDMFRKLERKQRADVIRDAISARESIGCLVCGREYSHKSALLYHVDRCQLEESEQPWKCYRCGFEGMGHLKEEHLNECARQAELKVLEKIEDPDMETKDLISLLKNPDSATAKKRRRMTGGAPRATARKNGTTLFRFRKSTVNREFNGVVTRKEQKEYEKRSKSTFDQWKIESSEVEFCEILRKIPKNQWKSKKLDEKSEFFGIFTRKSVTVTSEQAPGLGLREQLPIGIRIQALTSENLENLENLEDFQENSCKIAFCGAPINSIKVAPGSASSDDVISICTFANETTLESDSSVIQFWRFSPKKELKLWFLLEIKSSGAILSSTWLQKHDEAYGEGLVGFLALSTQKGQVLIYRIDEQCAPAPQSSELKIMQKEPDLTLKLPKNEEKLGFSPENPENLAEMLNSTIKSEEFPIFPEKIDQTTVPITKIAWAAQNGGRSLAGVTAHGALVLWDLLGDLEHPVLRIEPEWQSPPTDVAFLSHELLVVGFKERLVKVIDLTDWQVKLEENTVKTAGTRVHTDPRIVSSFFTFHSEYTSFPYPNATGIAYVNMDLESMVLVIVPTANTHQLMTWDMAMCPAKGTVLSCGIDGRLISSATGRLLKQGNYPFFANRNVLSLKRRTIRKDVKSMGELLKEAKNEHSEGEKSSKEPLEESILEHEQVCRKMWLEVQFDAKFDAGRPELSCRDQRIESLNCVDVNLNGIAFTGGEAGLLFAVDSRLDVDEFDL